MYYDTGINYITNTKWENILKTLYGFITNNFRQACYTSPDVTSGEVRPLCTLLNVSTCEAGRDLKTRRTQNNTFCETV